MPDGARNDLTIYDAVAADWWSDEIRWVRTLKNMVPGRLSYFDRFLDWQDKAVLDLGCAGDHVFQGADPTDLVGPPVGGDGVVNGEVVAGAVRHFSCPLSGGGGCKEPAPGRRGIGRHEIG